MEEWIKKGGSFDLKQEKEEGEHENAIDNSR